MHHVYNAVRLFAFLFLFSSSLTSQNEITQTLRGQINDADSRFPLPGIIIKLSGIDLTTSSDTAGYFRLEKVPVGSYTILVTGTGYEEKEIPDVMINAGKETLVSIAMKGSIHALKTVTVTAGTRDRPVNEFANASVRSISLDMAHRYPANGFDPARLVQNFAGVSFADDKSNSIIIRGNSPTGILWQLEGVEIPNPNHFGATGSGGGNISMLSSSTLDRSDFYTGAFPAEFGNALSGVFDLKLRNGNEEKDEHSLMIGTLGIEASTEGPFKRGGNSTYLVNARYSTLALVKSFAEINGISPDYQDISLKLNFVTKKSGVISLFGLGGNNVSKQEPEIIEGPFDFPPPFTLLRNIEKRAVMIGGISHQLFIGEKSFIRTVLAATTDTYHQSTDTLNPADHYAANPIGNSKFNSTAYKASIVFNHKFNNHLTQQTGALADLRQFNYQDNVYDLLKRAWYTFYQSEGTTMTYGAYTQWKWRPFEKINLTGGVHYTYLELNHAYSIDPRFAISFQSHQHNVVLAAGLHSKPEHLAVYYFIPQSSNQSEGANKNLGLTKASHLVMSYALRSNQNGLFKIEAYYQYLYNVPVERNTASFYTVLNSLDIFDLYQTDSSLVNTGKGRNYGVELTIEKSPANGIRYLLTASLFKSLFTSYSGKEFNSRFNRGYQVNTIIGKDWPLRKSQHKTIGCNIKGLVSGGLRESPIDSEQTHAQGKIVYKTDHYYENQLPYYARIDFGISYKINRRHSTHVFMLDFQNVTNRKNVFKTQYDFRSGQSINEYGLGLFPIFNYRIGF